MKTVQQITKEVETKVIIWLDFQNGKKNQEQTMSSLVEMDLHEFELEWFESQFELDIPNGSSMSTLTCITDVDNLDIDEEDEELYEELYESLKNLRSKYEI